MAILIAAALEAADPSDETALTDITGGGLLAGQAGTHMLNLCNDTDETVRVSAIYVTAGEDPNAAHKLQPAQTIEPRGWRALMPMALGEGFKVFLAADAPLSAQLNAKAD